MLRKGIAVIGGIVVAMLAAGCGNADNTADSPDVPSISDAAAPSSNAPSTQLSPTDAGDAPPPATPTPKPNPAADPNECTVADLKLSLADGDAAAGTVYRELRFTNAGDRTCVIQGFPGVSYVAGEDGHQVGPAAFREGKKGPPITLTPGKTAFAPLGFVQVRNYDPAVCKPTEVRGLRVYPPHEYDSMFLPAPGTGCAGTPPGNQLVVKTIQ